MFFARSFSKKQLTEKDGTRILILVILAYLFGQIYADTVSF